MRFAKPLAVAAIAGAALSAAATPSHAAPPEFAGCVTTYLDNRQPYLIDLTGVVYVDIKTLQVYANGGAVVGIAGYIVTNEANMAAALVACIV